MDKKIDKANELREKSNKAQARAEQLTEEWRLALLRARTPEKRKEIDERYSEKFEIANKKDSEAYKRYHDFVVKNFSFDKIQRATADGAFMDKTFITRLRKLEKKKVKKHERP